MNCEDFEDMETIISKNVGEICRMALENASYNTNSVVQIGVDDNQLHSCYLGTNEFENPANRVVEVYRLSQDFDMESCCDCNVCDECNEDGGACDEEQLFDCCLDELIIDFRDGFDDIMSAVYGEIEECGYDL